MWIRSLLAAFVSAMLSNCASDPKQDQNDSSAPAGDTRAALTDGTPNACALLTAAEVSAIVEHPIAVGKPGEGEPGLSMCDWEDQNGMAVFQLKVYWRAGRQMWSVWRTAQGISEEMFKKQEGVGLDSIVRQGPVAGIGDAAYFSEVLPSLLLKGDVLIEITNPIGKRPATKFRAMTGKLLARL